MKICNDKMVKPCEISRYIYTYIELVDSYNYLALTNAKLVGAISNNKEDE